MPIVPANPQAPSTALEYIRRATGKTPQSLPPPPAFGGGVVTASSVYMTDTRTMVDLGLSAVASVSGNATFQTWVQDFCASKPAPVPGDGPLLEVVFGVGYRVSYSAVGWQADMNLGFSALAAKAQAESRSLRLRVELIGLSPNAINFPYMDIADTDFSLSTYGKLAQFGLAVNEKVKKLTSASLVPIAISYRGNDVLADRDVKDVTRGVLLALWSLRRGLSLRDCLARAESLPDPVDFDVTRATYAGMLKNEALRAPGQADDLAVSEAVQAEAGNLLFTYNSET